MRWVFELVCTTTTHCTHACMSECVSICLKFTHWAISRAKTRHLYIIFVYDSIVHTDMHGYVCILWHCVPLASYSHNIHVHMHTHTHIVLSSVHILQVLFLLDSQSSQAWPAKNAIIILFNCACAIKTDSSTILCSCNRVTHAWSILMQSLIHM